LTGGIGMLQQGTLLVCPTPIGNLQDITLRVLDTLKKVDLIAAEDTRHSRKLLNHYDISTPLLSYHEHNERKRIGELLDRLKEGKNVALISDAGMPGISDPGHVLIRKCYEEDIKVDVLPGANAALTALVLSGMPTDSFVYLGFLPTGRSERRKILEKASTLSHTLIFYEAPHKLIRTLQDIQEIMGNRQAVVTRELTKIHQNVHRGEVSLLVEEFKTTPPKGECCLLVEAYEEKIERGEPSLWLRDMKQVVLEGKEKKEAMKIVAKKYGISRRDVYKASLDEDKKEE